MPGGWHGSTRRQRLPTNWPALRADAHRRNPQHICHLCGQPGGDRLDHIIRGDNHDPSNLDWAHDTAAPHCHRYKSSAEGNAARWRVRTRRPPEQHPGLK